MLRYNRTNVSNINYHIIFVTKYRKEIFDTDEKQEYVKEILTEISKGNGTIINNLEVMPDYVHMLIEATPKDAPSSIVKSFKGTSAREWFKEYPETKKLLWKGHLWSNSYFISTLGDVSKEIVMEYINNQKKELP